MMNPVDMGGEPGQDSGGMQGARGLVLGSLLALAACGRHDASGSSAQIAWQPYEEGLRRAKAEGKPVCLVIYTDSCPHCRSYSHVFEAPEVVERARSLVMIRLDSHAQRAVAQQYQRDGAYVPRTFFLAPDGTLDPEIHARRPKHRYFFDERDPRAVLAGMDEALRKLAK